MRTINSLEGGGLLKALLEGLYIKLLLAVDYTFLSSAPYIFPGHPSCPCNPFLSVDTHLPGRVCSQEITLHLSLSSNHPSLYFLAELLQKTFSMLDTEEV